MARGLTETRRSSLWWCAWIGLAACGPSTTADALGIREVELSKITAIQSMTRDCLVAGTTSGTSTVVPPFEARCHEGPGKQCEHSTAPVEVWEYDFPPEDASWHEWREQGYQWAKRTHFHKQFTWELDGDVCRFVATAYGDLDGDQVYSTYSRIATYRPGEAPKFEFQENNEE